MTQEYAEALARDALAMLKGFEKHLMKGQQLTITLDPKGEAIVRLSFPTTSGAIVAHEYYTAEGRLWYGGTTPLCA